MRSERPGSRQTGNEARHHPLSDRGFTMLEVLIGVSLMGSVALAIGASVQMSMLASLNAEATTELSARAMTEMEWLLLLPFDAPELQPGGSLTTSRTGYSRDPADDPDHFVRWEIVDETRLIKRIIVVSGQRTAASGPPRLARVETFRLRPGE